MVIPYRFSNIHKPSVPDLCAKIFRVAIFSNEGLRMAVRFSRVQSAPRTRDERAVLIVEASRDLQRDSQLSLAACSVPLPVSQVAVPHRLYFHEGILR